MTDEKEAASGEEVGEEGEWQGLLGGTDDEGLDEAFVEEVLHRAIRSTGTLDRQLRTSLFTLGMERTETVSVLFTAKPVSAALTKWPARFGLLLYALAALGAAIQWANTHSFKFNAGPHFRIVGNEFRGGTSSLNGANLSLSSFGILHDHRQIEASNVSVLGSTLEASFEEQQTMNGFYFHTASSSNPTSDPVRAKLYASSDRKTWQHYPPVSSSCAMDVPMERGVRVEVSWGAHARRVLIIGPAFVLASLLSFVALALAIAGNVLGGKYAFVGAICLTAVGLMAITPFGLCASDWFGAVQATDAVAFIVVGGLVGIAFAVWFERFIIWACGLLGASVLALAISEKEFGEQPDLYMWPVLMGFGATFVVFAISTWLMRWSILSRSRRLIEADLAAYNTVWSQICEDETCKADICSLAALASCIKERTTGRLRQYCENGSDVDWTCMDRGSFQRFSSSGVFLRRLSSGAGIWSIGGAAAGAGAAEREGEAEAAGVSEDADVELGEGLQRRASGLRGFKPCCEREEYVRKKSYTNGRSDKDSDLKLVSSLDQLYLKAACLSPVLRRKVQTWAATSGGGFPMKEIWTLGGSQRREVDLGCLEGGRQGVRRNQEVGESVRSSRKGKEVGWWRAGMLEDGFQWGRLKHPNRAIEKAVRSYSGGDVSRLLDICRECILFKDVAGITKCLKAIQGDPDIIVERIKNRFDPTYDATTSAGYRDVALNLRIVTRRTKEVGIHTHICEVQLIHLGFFHLKSAEGHTRYVTFRNLRAE